MFKYQKSRVLFAEKCLAFSYSSYCLKEDIGGGIQGSCVWIRLPRIPSKPLKLRQAAVLVGSDPVLETLALGMQIFLSFHDNKSVQTRALSPEGYCSPPQSLDKYSTLLKWMGSCADKGRGKLSPCILGMSWRTMASAGRENGFSPGGVRQHFEILHHPQSMLSPAWCMLSFIQGSVTRGGEFHSPAVVSFPSLSP